MDVFDLFAKIGLDTSEYEKGLDDAKQKNDGMKSSFSQVGKAAETLNNKYRVLAAQYEAAQKRVDELTDAFNKSAQETGCSSKETQELAQKLKSAEREADGLKSEIGELSSSTAGAGEEIRQAGNEASEAGGKFSGFAGHVSDLAGKLGQGIATAAKIGAAAIGTATAAVGALTKMSLDGYGEFEQLVGGVETLFGQSSDFLMSYANNAYKTAGLSANQYMETVTSFSASLLQSLGGDTYDAAEVANMAITDMADNTNKMGTAMESIQNAYQGFAKQNFTINLMSAARVIAR